ncbi:MAG: phage terminase large subunit family protein [Alphaproteobacteria bacterium]
MLRPPPQLTVSAWAEQHRILGSCASSEPGPWRTSRTPYLRDVMDALSAVHPAQRIVFLKGAQVRLREDIANAPVESQAVQAAAPVAAPNPETLPLMRRPGWLASRGGWLQ